MAAILLRAFCSNNGLDRTVPVYGTPHNTGSDLPCGVTKSCQNQSKSIKFVRSVAGHIQLLMYKI